MLENLKGKHVMLASNSPRRRELLSAMGVEFEVVAKEGVDESVPITIKAKDVAEYASLKKASAYRQDLVLDDILITADTVVVIDKRVIGKPKSEVEAREMLSLLSGKTHKVITGVSITSPFKQVAFSVKTKVTMRTLTDEVIDHYVKQFMPLDKAGAYGIQEWIGIVGVDYIEGSYQNVMGLPTQRLFAELSQF